MNQLKRSLLVALGAIALATSISVATTQHAAAAAPTYTTNTDAWCLGQTDVMAGLKWTRVNGAFPTGTTYGATGLAARVQDANAAKVVTANHAWVTWPHGSQWAATNVANFPSGKFAVNGAWYTRAQLDSSENWLATQPYHRIQFKLLWPNGTTTMSWTKWVLC